MLDPATLRDDLEGVRSALQKRGVDLSNELEELATLEARRRRILPELEGLKREQNAAADEVARAKRTGADASKIQEANRQRAQQVKQLEVELGTVEQRRNRGLLTIPNLVVNDLWISKLNKPGGINPAAPDFVSRGREAIVGLVQAYNGINVVLSRASGTGVSAETLQSLRGQQQRIKKSVQDLGNVILTRAKPADRPAALEICTVVRSEAPSILPSRCR